ncbi:hypothetical protein IT570_04355 [Candidatus Sumerlaeota bacterium]|nr:hypothetical protein [Candidatus Sumerlaeota bacterium]
MAEGTPQITTNSPAASRTKVAMFFVAFFLFTALVIGVGFYRRADTLALGGRSQVTIINGSPERLRTDIYVGPQFATIELNPGERESVRFSPRETLEMETNIVRFGEKIHTINGPTFSSDKATSVTLRLRGGAIYSLEHTSE